MISLLPNTVPVWLTAPLAQFWQAHGANGANIASAARASSGSLPQTIGINDAHGAGGVVFAVALAHTLLCEAPAAQGLACGACPQCTLLAAGNHTDLMQLVPEVLQKNFVPDKDKKPSKDIKIDQVRAIEGQLHLSAQRGGRKVVLVFPAENLGVVPANALLKTLEEPPLNTFFLLVSAHWPQVLPTVRSRCVSIALPAPLLAEKTLWLQGQGVSHPQRWLEIANHSADAAADMAHDPLWLPLLKAMTGLGLGAHCNPMELGQVFAKSELKRATHVLVLWMTDLLTVQQGGIPVFFKPQEASLQALSVKLDAKLACDYLEQLAQTSAIAEHPLNARSQCEALLFGYRRLFSY